MGNFRKLGRFLGSRSKPSNDVHHSIWVDLLNDEGSTPQDTSSIKHRLSSVSSVPQTIRSNNTSSIHPESTKSITENSESNFDFTTSKYDDHDDDRVDEVPEEEVRPEELPVEELPAEEIRVEEPRVEELRAEVENVKAEKDAAVSDVDADLLIFSDTTDAIPLFGRQFGIAPTSIVREQKDNVPNTAKKSPNGFEALFEQADAELEALYSDYMKSSGRQVPETGSAKIKTKTKTKTEDESCIICLESFSEVKAPDLITIACEHTPSVCYTCLAKSIKNDLETKFWNEIKCPECKTLLIHDDVRKFADTATFTRYERLSFRSAVTADKNFIWCLDCDFGQLHAQGESQPMIQCLSCSSVSCFKHAIKWHDGFTCEEYDTVLWDPDSYKAVKAKNNPEAKVPYMSKASMERAKRTEELRQRELYDKQKRLAKAEQEKEAASKGIKTNQKNKKDRNDEKENKEKKSQKELDEKIEMIRRRMREEELSASTVQKTTKRCPGCQWPIEKNEGCDHMTCIKCKHEFCWICLGSWHSHTRRCV